MCCPAANPATVNGAVQRENAPPSTLHSYAATSPLVGPKSSVTASPVTTGAAPGASGVSGGGPSTVQTYCAGDGSTAP